MIELFGVQLALDYRFGWLVLAALIGGLIRGFAGFGSALLIVPALALMFSAREAIAIELILEIPAMITLLPAAVRNAERAVVGPMLASLFVTVPLGALALLFLDDAVLKIIISVAVLLMVVILALQREITALISRRTAIAAGMASGFIQGAAGVGGPPSVVAILALGNDATVSRANVIAFMTGLLGISGITLAIYGLYTREILVTGALVSPVLLLSVFAGIAAFKRYGDRWLRPVALVVVAITALVTLASTVVNVS
jgi:uncharacterized membrane protein YfcA